MRDYVTKILERFSKAESDRQAIDPILQDIADYFLVHKGNFNRSTTPTQIETNKLYDITGVEAAKRLASTIHGGLTNSSSKWFVLQAVGQTSLSTEAKAWLEMASEKMLTIFNGSHSGFSSNNYEVIMSQVTAGTGVLMVDYDQKCNSLKFSSVHVSKVYFLEDRWGNVDVIFVKDSLTIRQAAQEFGLEALSENWKRLYESDPDRKVEILHCVKPVDELSTKKYSRFKYESIYVDLQNKHIIEDKPISNIPYVIGRFDRRAGEIWGTSPAWDALPEVKMLNQMKKDFIKAAQLKTQPPLLLSDDAVMPRLDVKPFGKITGGIDPITGRPRLMPLEVGGDLNGTLVAMESARQQVRELFFVDALYFKDGTPLTATEAVQRQEARSQMLSPAIDRIKTEYLDNLIRTCFNILLNNKHLGEVPEELANESLKVEYLSPLARLNKMQDVLAIQRALAPMAPFASMAPDKFQGMFDAIRFDETVVYALNAAGFPSTLLKTEKELEAEKQAKAQQANLAQNLQLAQFASQLNKPIQ